MLPGGRPVFAPAGVVHWHGASPDEYVVQLTVLGGGDGGPTSWFGPVSGRSTGASKPAGSRASVVVTRCHG